MDLRRNLSKFNFSHLALLSAMGLIAGCGQQTITTSSLSPQLSPSVRGVVDDWSTHHVRFSDPGSEADAIRNGTHDKWLKVISNPRYQMQQLRIDFPGRFRKVPGFHHFRSPMHRDWTTPIAPAGYGTSTAYPAKYSFDINAAPDCSDLIVYPAIAGGSATQASIIGFNNLYDGTCPSSAPSGQPFAPSVKFAYDVGTAQGQVYTSPTLSLDGTKVAFVEDDPYRSYFHVLTLGTTGSNGTAYDAPVQPCTQNGSMLCTTNNAADNSIAMGSTHYSSRSDPFIDYANDVAYVADSGGNLYKFTGVFNGTPAEVTTGGWPFSITTALTSPVYDSVSQHIFVTSYISGVLCIDVSSGSPTYCKIAGVTAFTNFGDAPIVDSTSQMVFATGYGFNGTNYVGGIQQTDTNMANGAVVHLGYMNYSPRDFDFDNTYYSGNYASGYLYACGGAMSATNQNLATLYRIGFDSTGKMNSSTDGNSYPLATSASVCSPLTEVYNSSQGKDYLFLGVDNYGAPASCNGYACVMSLVLPSPGGAFPNDVAAGYSFGANDVTIGGIVIDNVSNEAGASQIYFMENDSGSATQLSQNGLN